MKRVILAAAMAALASQFGGTGVVDARQVDDLKFRKSYFVTGDYVVAGIGLRGRGGQNGVAGKAVANINVANVPPGADIVAAHLYWQVVGDTPTVGSAGVKFKGQLLELPDDPDTVVFDPLPYAKTLTFAGTAPCFNPGGGTTGTGPFTYTYMLDVLRFFDVDTTSAPTSPTFGKTIVNGSHQVQIPDSGPNGNIIPMALGASLMIVFRYPDNPLLYPQKDVLNAIVVVDDGVSLTNAQRTLLNQPLPGFYKAFDPDADADTPNARVSYIAGSGQLNKGDAIIRPDGVTVPNPFVGSTPATDDGDQLGAWDTLTYPMSIPAGATAVTTTVTTDILDPGGRDCISIAAIIFKTAVEDTDGDGLLDVWETATVASPLSDPRGRQLPPLGMMGANPLRKDLFIEIGYMDALEPLSYGGAPPAPAHSHRPTLEALALMGKAFHDGPVPVVPSSPTPFIAVHFDVGPDYFDSSCSSASTDCANHYIIGRRAGERRVLARGGESVNEMDTVTGCVLDPAKPWVCQYSAFPGTVAWKTGLRFIQDRALSITPAPPPPPPMTPPTSTEEYCDQPGYTCVRRFEEMRRNMFHYAFFAHHLGYPQSVEPFLPVGSTIVNPLFRVPVTNTGIGDFPGGDVLVTLGAFLDNDSVAPKPIGTPYMQASTLMHELGHNFQRRHGGEPDEPNCKPPYLSVMNYLYQLRGLLDDDGKPHLGFMSPTLDPNWPTTIHENGLTDESLGLHYRIGWYAPLIGSYLDPTPNADPDDLPTQEQLAKVAKRYCNGAPFPVGTNPMMARVDAPLAAGSIDWNANLANEADSPDQDLNLDGSLVDTLSPSDDWAKLRLNQVGSRRSPAGYFLVYKEDGSTVMNAGPLSINASGGDLGPGDLSYFPLGAKEFGAKEFGAKEFGAKEFGAKEFGANIGDLGAKEFGAKEFGAKEFGAKEFGSGDQGLGDHGGGDLINGQGEVNAKHANDLARTPPNEFNATQDVTQGSDHYVTVTFKAPNLGGVKFYTVRRVAGSIPVIAKSSIPPGTITQLNGVFSMVDLDSHRLKAGQDYSWFATATYEVEKDGGGTELLESEISRVKTLNVVNDDPKIVVSNIPASQTIATNSTTVALPFTVSDTESDSTIGNPLKDLSVTPVNVSSTPGISFDVKGFGKNRSVRVIHSGSQTGTVTVRLDVSDTQCTVDPFPPPSCSAPTVSSTTFTVTVNATVATFAPVSGIPAVTAGNPVVMTWSYMPQNAGSKAVHKATVVGPSPSGVVRTYSGTQFVFNNSTKTWRFTLPTNNLPAGTYQVVIGTSEPMGYQSSKAFQLVIP